MRTLVLRIANAHALASVNVELGVVDAQGQQTLTFATLKSTAAALLAEAEADVSLKYEDSDGDMVTLASESDLREAIEFMEEARKDRLDVVVKTNSSIVKQHFLGLVAAVTRLANALDVNETKEEFKRTVTSTFDALHAAVAAWEVADAKELESIKADLLVLAESNDLRTVINELSVVEEYKEFVEKLVNAIYRGESVEELITTKWNVALSIAKDALVRCPELKTTVIRVAKACAVSMSMLNSELLAAETMPTLEQVVEEEEKSSVPTAAVVHERFCCDGCGVSPIVGSRFRSTKNPNFDLCESCYATGVHDEKNSPFTQVDVTEQVHFGVECDGCQQSPIAGIRYKSLMVNDFDLCEVCEASGKWTTHEPFIKIKNPSSVPRTIEVHIEPPAQPDSPPQFHPFVTCDGCEMTPLVGTRYKSTNMHDFDLCEKCHGSGAWTQSHGPFRVVDAVSNFCGFKKWWKHEKKAHKKFAKAMRKDFGCMPFTPPPAPFAPPPPPSPFAPEAPFASPAPHGPPHPHPHPRPDHHHHHHHHHGHHHRHHHGHHHDDQGNYEAPPVAEPVELGATFIEDVTIPDGTVVAPDVQLVKAWKVKNTGSTMWPEGCIMKMQTGRFGVAPFEGDPATINARVPPLAPEEEFEVEVQLVTPSEAGRYTAYWRMVDPSDQGFGHRFWIDVVVSEVVIVQDEPGAPLIMTAAVVEAEVPEAESDGESDAESDGGSDVESDGELVRHSEVDSESDVEVGSDDATDRSSVSSEEDDDRSDTSESDSSEHDDDQSGSDSSSVDVESESENDEAAAEEAVESESAPQPTEDAPLPMADDVVGELYEEALSVLEAMGFGDREQNRVTLAHWSGNIADAVNSLLMD